MAYILSSYLTQKSSAVLALMILAVCLIPLAGAQAGKTEPSQMLFHFTTPEPDNAWQSTNDGVMGGLSEGAARITPEGMLFSGVLSLENNGGFSSIRQRTSLDLSSFSGIRLKVRGDGRAYQLRLESDARYGNRGAVSFSGDIPTVAGEWVEVDVPFGLLQQSWRGRQLSEYTFNPKVVQMVGLMLADKQPGDFQLEVAWIAAY